MSDDRYILVVADNSEEMNTALEYACARSKKTGRKITVSYTHLTLPTKVTV